MIELVKHEKDNGLYQWDTGRKVQLTDESLSIAEVHFSNIYLPEALIVEPNSDGTADTRTSCCNTLWSLRFMLYLKMRMVSRQSTRHA